MKSHGGINGGIAFTLLALTALAVFLALDGIDDSDTIPSTNDEHVEAAAQTQVALASEVNNNEAGLRALTMSQLGTNDRIEDANARIEELEAQIAELDENHEYHEHEERPSRREMIVTHFEAQERDEEWAPDYEEHLVEYISSAVDEETGELLFDPGTTIEEVECRSTSCRMLLSHDSLEATNRTMVPSHPPCEDGGCQGTLRRLNPDDPTDFSVEMYVSRVGHDLPRRERDRGHRH